MAGPAGAGRRALGPAPAKPTLPAHSFPPPGPTPLRNANQGNVASRVRKARPRVIASRANTTRDNASLVVHPRSARDGADERRQFDAVPPWNLAPRTACSKPYVPEHVSRPKSPAFSLVRSLPRARCPYVRSCVHCRARVRSACAHIRACVASMRRLHAARQLFVFEGLFFEDTSACLRVAAARSSTRCSDSVCQPRATLSPTAGGRLFPKPRVRRLRV